MSCHLVCHGDVLPELAGEDSPPNLDAPGDPPRVIAGYVDSIFLWLGEEPVAQVVDLYGPAAATFADLIETSGLPWAQR